MSQSKISKKAKSKANPAVVAQTRWVELLALAATAALVVLVIIHGQQIKTLQDKVHSLEMEQSL